MPQVWALTDYLREHPPTHVLVAAYLGYEPPAKQEHSIEMLHLLLGAAGFKTGGGKINFPDGSQN